MVLSSNVFPLLTLMLCVRNVIMTNYKMIDVVRDRDQYRLDQIRTETAVTSEHRPLTNERSKRGLPRKIADVLKFTKQVMKVKHYGVYQRKGGYSTALSDFTLLEPTHVRYSGKSVIFGRAEGRNVMLYRMKGNTWMNIWTNKKAATEGEETWSRINYVD